MTIALIAALALVMVVPAVAVAKAPAHPKGKPTFVSHPYTKKKTVKLGSQFRVWGYINTWHRVPLTSDATLTIVVKQKIGHSWETSAGLTTTATISASGKFRKKTNYNTYMTIGAKGSYRLRAVLVWTDTNGVQHTKWSSYKNIKVKAIKTK